MFQTTNQIYTLPILDITLQEIEFLAGELGERRYSYGDWKKSCTTKRMAKTRKKKGINYLPQLAQDFAGPSTVFIAKD